MTSDLTGNEANSSTAAALSAVGAAQASGAVFRRDTQLVTICTLISRVTGFARVAAVAAVLGSGLLADVYQTANVIPNLMFEFVAAGALQAVLVPSFVAARRQGGDAALSEATRATSGVVFAGLSAIALIGIVSAPWLARVLVITEPSSAVADDKLNVMVPMVIAFIPQLICYGLAAVISAALHAKGRFVAAALAPAVNNFIVIIACVAFRASRGGRVADLDLTASQFWLITAGTTIGVIAFSLAPAMALRRIGVQWSPQWRPQHEAVQALKRSFRWAWLSTVGTLVPTIAAIVLGNGAPGGVAVFVYAFAFFVLPHALIAVTVATTLAPRVANEWQDGRKDQVAATIDKTMRLTMPLLVIAAAGMGALAWPATRVLAGIGQTASQGLAPIAHTLAAFGPGLIGYGVAFVMLRVLFTIGDVRMASLLTIYAAVTGVIVMIVASHLMSASDRAPALAIGYGAAQTLSAILLTKRVHDLTGAMPKRQVFGLLGESLVAGGIAVGVMVLSLAVFEQTRREAVPAVLLGGIAGLVAFAAAMFWFRRRELLARWRGFGDGSNLAG